MGYTFFRVPHVRCSTGYFFCSLYKQENRIPLSQTNNISHKLKINPLNICFSGAKFPQSTGFCVLPRDLCSSALWVCKHAVSLRYTFINCLSGTLTKNKIHSFQQSNSSLPSTQLLSPLATKLWFFFSKAVCKAIKCHYFINEQKLSSTSKGITFAKDFVSSSYLLNY